MKDNIVEIKKKIFNKDFAKNLFLAAFLIIFFLFLYINESSFQFLINNFSKAFSCDLQVYFIDVDQANATLIIFPNKMAMLVDSGSQKSGESLSEDVDYILHKNGIDEIEYLILTHSDEDHVGGTEKILEDFKINNILRPKQLSKNESSIFDYSKVDTEIYEKTINAIKNEEKCKVSFVDDMVLNFAQAKVEIFGCEKDKYSETNSYSPFVLIEYFNKSFLLTGDATTRREYELIDFLEENNLEMDVDYLLVSHHGSKYSTTDNFLDVIKPNYAFVSAGEDYYPSIEVKERLTKHGVNKIYSTNEVSTIAVGLEKDSSVIVCMTNFFDIPFVFVCVTLVVFAFMKSSYYSPQRWLSKKQKFLILMKKSS